MLVSIPFKVPVERAEELNAQLRALGAVPEADVSVSNLLRAVLALGLEQWKRMERPERVAALQTNAVKQGRPKRRTE